MAGRPKSVNGQAAIARAWGISQAAVNKWKKLGCPVNDIEAATKWRDEYLAANNAKFSGSLNDSRQRNMDLKNQLLELKIAQEKKELVTAVSQREAGIRIGAILSAKFAALVNDAAGLFAGLNGPEVTKRIHERTQTILAEFREELEKV